MTPALAAHLAAHHLALAVALEGEARRLGLGIEQGAPDPSGAPPRPIIEGSGLALALFRRAEAHRAAAETYAEESAS
jgi:hypothetical protein